MHHPVIPISKPLSELLGLQKPPMYKLSNSINMPNCPRSLTLEPIKHVHWYFDRQAIYNKSSWESSNILHTVVESQLSHRYGCQPICFPMNYTPSELFYSLVLPLNLPINLREVSWIQDYLGTKQVPQTLPELCSKIIISVMKYSKPQYRVKE